MPFRMKTDQLRRIFLTYFVDFSAVSFVYAVILNEVIVTISRLTAVYYDGNLILSEIDKPIQ